MSEKDVDCIALDVSMDILLPLGSNFLSHWIIGGIFTCRHDTFVCLKNDIKLYEKIGTKSNQQVWREASAC